MTFELLHKMQIHCRQQQPGKKEVKDKKGLHQCVKLQDLGGVIIVTGGKQCQILLWWLRTKYLLYHFAHLCQGHKHIIHHVYNLYRLSAMDSVELMTQKCKNVKQQLHSVSLCRVSHSFFIN